MLSKIETPQSTTLVVPVAATVAIKVGDKVCRTALVEDEDPSFYRVKSVSGDIFETDPNSPFEKGWKGKVTNFKQHPTYPGYWVPLTRGVAARTAVKAQPVEARYSIDVNWYGEIHKVTAKAYSESQAVVRAAKTLSRTSLTAYTEWHIRNYLKQNTAKVTVKQIG